MTHMAANRSDKTKRSLAKALSQLLQRQSLDEITIRQVTDLCGINRQTFYYHFNDIYDLFRWSFANDILNDMRASIRQGSWEAGLGQLLDYFHDNCTVWKEAFTSHSGEEITRMLTAELSKVIMEIMTTRMVGVPGSAMAFELPADADLYAAAVTGVMQSWITGGCVSASPQKMTAFIVNLIEDAVSGRIHAANTRAQAEA